MPLRIEISSTILDTRALVRAKHIRSFGFNDSQVRSVMLVDVYTVDKELSKQNMNSLAMNLSNPITEKFKINSPVIMGGFDFALEIGYLPGVTDNVGNTARQTAEDLIGLQFDEDEAIYSSQIIFISGKLTRKDASNIALDLSNPLIHRTHIKSCDEYIRDEGMDIIIPKVHLHDISSTDSIDINISEDALLEMGKRGIKDPRTGEFRGPLALSLDYMKSIRDYFIDVEQRNPTDAEIETLAQTWSEHCKHTIFADPIDDIQDGIYRHYIKRATQDIRQSKGSSDYCVSVFKDNSGAVEFDDNFLVTDKAETHNSPSALDPFGGAITGIVGVNRDTIGFGLGAKPIINGYGFCLADPRKDFNLYRGKGKSNPMLSPRKIMEGIVSGVNVGGNSSGIPTPIGFVSFDDRYAGKPLVFVRTIGLIPKDIHILNSDDATKNHVLGYEKKAQPGDKIVMIGGRVGKDGIHGATFSSEALDTGSPVSAVQIGDPITQKKLSDAIVKEARQFHLFHAITDNGAGGLSSSVGEMAQDSGGCEVWIEHVPLKYPGLSPWEIWISESQERMTLAVAPQNLPAFEALMAKRGVESSVIGEFTNSGRCIVRYNDERVVDIDMEFLHDGNPAKQQRTTYTPPLHNEPRFDIPADLNSTYSSMLSRLNICSYDFISYQYDYVVQGNSALGPLQGKGKVNAETTATCPLLPREDGTFEYATKAIVTSQGILPRYSDIDTYHMAAAALDTAIRNVVAAGADPGRISLMDNFCWYSSNDSESLGKLKRSAEACYRYATSYGTPFISGKDSMFNDFKGFDEADNPVKISIPPTLLISSLGIVDDPHRLVSLDFKVSGDLVYVLGRTKNELGASEYYALIGDKMGEMFVGNTVPHVDDQVNKELYSCVYQATKEGLLASSISVGIGGIGVALAKSSIGGQHGVQIDLDTVVSEDELRADMLLFSESQGRILVTVAPQNQLQFETIFSGVPFSHIGFVTEEKSIHISLGSSEIINQNLKDLDMSYKSPLSEY